MDLWFTGKSHTQRDQPTHTTMVSQRADPGGQSSSVGHFPYIVNLHYSRIVQNIEKDSGTQSDVQEKHDSVSPYGLLTDGKPEARQESRHVLIIDHPSKADTCFTDLDQYRTKLKCVSKKKACRFKRPESDKDRYSRSVLRLKRPQNEVLLQGLEPGGHQGLIG